MIKDDAEDLESSILLLLPVTVFISALLVATRPMRNFEFLFTERLNLQKFISLQNNLLVDSPSTLDG